MKKKIQALIDSINDDIQLYCSQFVQEQLSDHERRIILSRINGKKCALEIVSGDKYEFDGAQLKKV